MSYSRFSVVDFGSSRSGLATVGYRIYTQPSNTFGTRITAGVNEIVAGKFGAAVTIADAFVGAIVWDTGEATPSYGLDVINPAPAVNVDIAAVAAAVWNEAIAGHLAAGSTGAKLNAAGAAGDPWTTALPGSYAEGEAGAIIGRFNVAPVSSPLVVVPGAPADLSLCRVYGYFEDLANIPAAGINVTFTLVMSVPGAVRSERLITGRAIKATIVNGVLTDKAGNAWQDLQRNDLLHPAGTKYRVLCDALGFDDVEVTLAADLFDLASIVP